MCQNLTCLEKMHTQHTMLILQQYPQPRTYYTVSRNKLYYIIKSLHFKLYQITLHYNNFKCTVNNTENFYLKILKTFDDVQNKQLYIDSRM